MMKNSVLFWVFTGLGFVVPGVQAQQSASAHVPAVSKVQPEVASGQAGTEMSAEAPYLTEADTLIRVSNVRVSRSKGDLFVAMDLDVSRLKVRTDREYYYVPRVKAADGHEVALPAVVMASRNIYYRHLRNQDLPDDVLLYDSRDLLSVSYRVAVPFEPWMATAVLQAGETIYPMTDDLAVESRELHALSLATGLATAMALSPEQQQNLSKELEALTLTPEMQDLLAQALQTIAENPGAAQATQATLPAPTAVPSQSQAPVAEPTQSAQPVQPIESTQLAQSTQPAEPTQPAQPIEPTQLAQPTQSAELTQLAQSAQPSQPAQPTEPSQPAQSDPEASDLNADLAQAIGLLGLSGEVQVRLVNEIQALPMSPELRTVLITALQTLAKAEAFVPVFVYRTPAAEESKIRAEKGTANIEFRLNETGIDPYLRGNRAELDKIRHTVEALANDADYTLKTMKVKGYASPEGAYDLNTALAKKRMEAVKAYVRGLINLPSDRIAADYEAEDWDGLKMVLEASTLPHKADILKIMADTRLTPDAREWKIKSAYKDDYAYMRTYMYPALRHVDYEVEYEVRAYVDVAEIVRLLGTQPQKLSLQEMYRAAQTMVEGSEDYDEVFETAVRLFPADETANLNAANSAMRWRDLNRAERYLAKAGQGAEAVYARGNHAALRGDYEAAANYFKQAADKGLSEATAAMEQLRTLQAKTAPEPQAPAQDGKAARAKDLNRK